jgi:cytochrome o ubiquinol oxidase operon protein cyoD
MAQQAHTTHVSITTYAIGFVLSIVLTLVAYFAVVNEWLNGVLLVGVLIGLALTQFIVQAVLFLHVGDEARPKWNLTSFLFMLLVVVTIVIGSLWIMSNLNYNMMSSEQMDAYMKVQSSKGF